MKNLGRSKIWRLFYGCGFAAVLLVLLAMAGLLVVYQGCNYFVKEKERESVDRWESHMGSIDAFLSRHPPNKANLKVRNLDSIAEAMGLPILVHLDLRPPAIHEWDGENKKEIEKITRAFREYLKAEIQNPQPILEKWPDPCEKFVCDHHLELQLFRSELMAGSLPAWDCDLHKLREAPIPGLMHTLDLQRIYLCMALQETREGRDDEALQWMETSWRLCEALNKRPELISKIIWLAGLRYHIGVVRKLDRIPPAWLERFQAVSPQEMIAEGYREDLWGWVGMGRRSNIDDQTDMFPLTRYWRFPPFRLYARLSIAGIVARYDEVLRNLPKDPQCEFDPDAGIWENHFPKWNILGKVGAAEVSDAWVRAGLTQIDLELTEKIRILKELRRTRKGYKEWRHVAPDLEQSKFSGIRYVLELQKSDGVTLRCACDFPNLDQKIKMLPLEYRESPK